MKIAHVIMAYKNPGQIERLIKSLNHPNFYFYIHLDQKIDIKDFEYLGKLDKVFFIKNRVLCNWGGYSFVKAIMSTLKEILDTGEGYQTLNLLSGQDYPIKSAADIYSFFAANKDKNFISYDQDPHKKWWNHAVKRSELYHFTDLSFKGKYFVQAIFNKCLPKRSFPSAMLLYGSSDSSWWTISAECAAYLVEFMPSNPKLNRFMAYTWGSDEFLIATIIMNSPYRDKVINDNMRYITWTDGLANPRIFTISDIDALRATHKLFARKFDTTVDETILDELDSIYVNQDR